MSRWDEDVCAQDRTHGKADTCNGDSGGPMTVQENFRSDYKFQKNVEV